MRHGVNCLFLSGLIDGPSTTSSPTSPSLSRASNLLWRGTWGSEVGREGVAHDAELRLAFKPPHLFGPLPQPDRDGVWALPRSGGHPPWCPSLQHTRELLHPSVSCSHALMLLSLSTCRRLSSKQAQAVCPEGRLSAAGCFLRAASGELPCPSPQLKQAGAHIERICTHVWLLPVDHTTHLRALRIPYEEAYGNRS